MFAKSHACEKFGTKAVRGDVYAHGGCCGKIAPGDREESKVTSDVNVDLTDHHDAENDRCNLVAFTSDSKGTNVCTELGVTTCDCAETGDCVATTTGVTTNTGLATGEGLTTDTGVASGGCVIAGKNRYTGVGIASVGAAEFVSVMFATTEDDATTGVNVAAPEGAYAGKGVAAVVGVARAEDAFVGVAAVGAFVCATKTCDEKIDSKIGSEEGPC